KKTPQGVELFHQTLGFRLYMNTAERYRQQFAEKAEIFTQLLPYAIVFGCVSGWAQAFAGLDTGPATAGWYAGAGPLQAAALSSTLQGFDAQVSSFIASTPGSSGSSGFGGGGGSGGGGGGGGGGAW
ncbi:MAG TPA: hypothetical protein VK131_07610, partial [Candidatus Acidoferrales bacterium]|nr:hypothetical protein [Candidatus Acidoferrales bacterium]